MKGKKMDGHEAILHDLKRKRLYRIKHGEGPAEVLDEITLRAVEKGIRSETEDPEYNWEEVKKFARERRKAWMTIPDSLSA